MKACFGLGNPGKRYKKTRHNFGYRVVDYYLSKAEGIREKKMNYSQVYQRKDLLLVKPLTYMNLSGLAVFEVYKEFNLFKRDCLIIYDDFSIPFGEIKAKAGGGAGGHKGMASVIEHLGEDIPRLKLGIGNRWQGDLTEYVLKEFTLQEEEVVKAVCERAALAIECFYKKDIDAVMNLIN
jgi:PTH1 family peptidyl-tRNA hydrolase